MINVMKYVDLAVSVRMSVGLSVCVRTKSSVFKMSIQNFAKSFLHQNAAHMSERKVSDPSDYEVLL